jgi:hypothetical protein
MRDRCASTGQGAVSRTDRCVDGVGALQKSYRPLADVPLVFLIQEATVECIPFHAPGCRLCLHGRFVGSLNGLFPRRGHRSPLARQRRRPLLARGAAWTGGAGWGTGERQGFPGSEGLEAVRRESLGGNGVTKQSPTHMPGCARGRSSRKSSNGLARERARRLLSRRCHAMWPLRPAARSMVSVCPSAHASSLSSSPRLLHRSHHD